MSKKVAILGASVGGLVAASELVAQGFNVDIFEKGKAVGGLFNKIETPFGLQELGMHVLYAGPRHHELMTKIFGPDAFDVLTGVKVDLGACSNFDKTFFNSMYPNLIGHTDQQVILDEIIESGNATFAAESALQEAQRRFGKTAAQNIVGPILEKLWLNPAEQLTPGALYCFYDLRRLVVCEKHRADELKADPRLDDVIANPDQLHPFGEIFGGRMALLIRDEAAKQLNEKARAWAELNNVGLELSCDITVNDGRIEAGGRDVTEEYDSIIISLPLHSLASGLMDSADRLELSIYYFELDGRIGVNFPAYYSLAHDPALKSSRIVNYDGYNKINNTSENSVFSVEVIHPANEPPENTTIAEEITRVVPQAQIVDSYRLERTVGVYPPTRGNAEILDRFQKTIQDSRDMPVYFTGMRTDKGIFFSHDTIGLAHEAALEISGKQS
jgi:hypothetical protein